MSNKIVPGIYRAIIDDVIASIKSEFDDYGVGEDILSDLQSRWENKVIASRVADFEVVHPQTQAQSFPHPVHTQQHPTHQMHPGYQPYLTNPPQSQQQQQQQQPQVKAEPVDNRFPVATYTLPALPGPQLNLPTRPATGTPVPPTNSSYLTPNGQHQNGTARPPTYLNQPSASVSSGNGQAQPRIPQVDGSSSGSSESSSPPPSQTYAPRAAHPSLPQPAQSNARPADSEEINSDLDDSDSDAEEEEQEGSLGETDIVFCTYDKVARVKNKWKCVLKDGMIHVNGKDYLFTKCTCEFEW